MIALQFLGHPLSIDDLTRLIRLTELHQHRCMLVAYMRLDFVRIRCDLPNHWLLVSSHSDAASCEGELVLVTSA